MMPSLGLLFVCDPIGQLNRTLSSEHTSFQKGKTEPLTKVTLVSTKENRSRGQSDSAAEGR